MLDIKYDKLSSLRPLQDGQHLLSGGAQHPVSPMRARPVVGQVTREAKPPGISDNRQCLSHVNQQLYFFLGTGIAVQSRD
jgi:hypothetical protein